MQWLKNIKFGTRVLSQFYRWKKWYYLRCSIYMRIKFLYLTYDPLVNWKIQIYMKEDNSNTLPRVNFLDHFIGKKLWL